MKRLGKFALAGTMMLAAGCAANPQLGDTILDGLLSLGLSLLLGGGGCSTC